MEERSYLPITVQHLKHLCDIAIKDQKDFFRLNPKYRHYENERKAILLIQGAALHFINGKEGIKDFDVLVVYNKLHNPIRLYAKRKKAYNSNMPEFGRFPKDKPKYVTRRVDILMREIEISSEEKLSDTLQNFIKHHKYWGEKAAIGIWPDNILEEIIYRRGD